MVVGLAVAGPEGLEVAAVEGGVAVAPERVPPEMRAPGGRPLLVAAALTGADALLRATRRRLAVAAGVPATIERALFEVLAAREGALAWRALLEVRNRGRAALRVGARPGARLVAASAGDQALTVGIAGPGEWVVPLPLSPPGRRGPEPVTLALSWLDSGPALGLKGHLDVELPRLDLPVSEAVWSVTLPRGMVLRSFEGPAALVEEGAAVAWTRELCAAGSAESVALRLPAESPPILFRRLLWIEGPLPLSLDYEEAAPAR
ncbi:MAG: hypothetical protein HZA54_03320 [Planctomycetes bacterium]|nr:hypothetical protein [Planctomycetota bacterium]